jgi:hypothetical protein
MTTKKKIKFADIVYSPAFNTRAIDDNFVENLTKDIPKFGLSQNLHVASHMAEDADGEMKQLWRLVDGNHRYLALDFLRNNKEEAFNKAVPGGTLEVLVIEGDVDALRDHSERMNAQRVQMQPWELMASIIRRRDAGQNQYDISEMLNIQQPRVNEYLSFEKLLPEIIDAWKSGLLHHQDLVKFATMSAEDQETAFTGFEKSVKETGGKKAKARKDLKKAAKEKGNVREYANAGKPTRKKLEGYVPFVARSAQTAEDEVTSAFFNGLAAGLKIVNGTVDFAKVSPEKSYTTKADARLADKVEAEEAEKAEAKAERLAAKAEKEKAAKKAEKAPKAAKAPKAEKPAKVRAAKQPKAAKAEKVTKPKAEKKAKAPKAEKVKKAKAPKKAKADKTAIAAE